MKRLIVNADDLGYTTGINRGIVEAHERGIVTSTSMMVDPPGAEEGAEIARATPSLSVGLHAELDRDGALTVTRETCAGELDRQLGRFEQLVGAAPTHLDAEGLVSRYTVEREREIATLTDPRVRARIDELGIELIGWKDVS